MEAKNARPNGDASLMVNICQDRVQAQLDSVNTIDSKAGVLLGVATALIAILGAALPVVNHPPQTIAAISLVVSLLAYATVAVASFRSLNLREWAFGPDPDYMLNRYGRVDDRELTWEVAEGYAKAFLVNESGFRDKTDQARTASIFLVVQGTAMFACFSSLALGL